MLQVAETSQPSHKPVVTVQTVKHICIHTLGCKKTDWGQMRIKYKFRKARRILTASSTFATLAALAALLVQHSYSCPAGCTALRGSYCPAGTPLSHSTTPANIARPAVKGLFITQCRRPTLSSAAVSHCLVQSWDSLNEKRKQFLPAWLCESL